MKGLWDVGDARFSQRICSRDVIGYPASKHKGFLMEDDKGFPAYIFDSLGYQKVPG